jgi:hypothetical protein
VGHLGGQESWAAADIHDALAWRQRQCGEGRRALRDNIGRQNRTPSRARRFIALAVLKSGERT